MVVWGVGTGTPELDPQTDGYANDVNSWLVVGPIDMSNAGDGVVTFDLFLDAVSSVPGDPNKPGNTFAMAISTDGSTYTGVQIIDGGTGKWESFQQSLLDYVGEEQVRIAFIFRSDNQPNPDNKLGALLDNVEISINRVFNVYLPILNFFPTPKFLGPNEEEPNNKWDQANGPIVSGINYRGNFSFNGDINDYFYFYKNNHGIIDIHLSDIPSGQDYDLILLDGNLEIIKDSGRLGNREESITIDIPNGLYFVWVFNSTGETNSNKYNLIAIYE